jgi:hypothetical protein
MLEPPPQGGQLVTTFPPAEVAASAQLPGTELRQLQLSWGTVMWMQHA